MDELLDHAPCGYLSFDDQGRILRVNQTLSGLLGFTVTELEGMNVETILNLASRIFYQTHFFPLLKLQNKAEEIFLTLRDRNGNSIPVISNAVRGHELGRTINNCILITVHQRRKYEDEILAAKKEAEAALKENRELLKTREQLAHHSELLDRQLTKLNQMTNEILQFNSIISHDMQECVRKILMFVQLANSNKDISYLEKVIKSAYRLRRINENLDLFVSLGLKKEEFQPLPLNTIIAEATEKVMQEKSFENLYVSCPSLPDIIGSKFQIRLLFYHLLDNAVKFRKGDEVHVTIDYAVFEANQYKSTMDRYRFAEVLKIELKDDGAGFNNAYKDYVFNLFKKLDAHSGDLGFGLALCKKIVDNHHGQIAVNSQRGKGTTVTVILPLEPDMSMSPKVNRRAPDYAG